MDSFLILATLCLLLTDICSLAFHLVSYIRTQESRGSTLLFSRGFGTTPISKVDSIPGRKLYRYGEDDRILKIPNVDESCVCCSGLTYGQCCGILHETTKSIYEPAQLVRARYAAYALGLPDFLIHTTHPLYKDYVKYLAGRASIAKAFKVL
jgi:hypothetical protein